MITGNYGTKRSMRNIVFRMLSNTRRLSISTCDMVSTSSEKLFLKAVTTVSDSDRSNLEISSCPTAASTNSKLSNYSKLWIYPSPITTFHCTSKNVLPARSVKSRRKDRTWARCRRGWPRIQLDSSCLWSRWDRGWRRRRSEVRNR